MDIKLEINNQPIAVREGSTLMEAIQKLNLYVPHFCYHEKLSIAANCRMCMVDVQKAPKALPACATPAVDGMVVFTDSERAKKAQQGVMEFLLINHPLDCPICDQGGECQLQDLAVGYGISRSRYQEEKRVVFEKNLGPLISTDMTRCIHCTRCVRFGREVAGIMELGMTGRGEHAEIMPFVERTVDSELSGNMIDICPVGALTSKPFRYSARPWELRKHSAVSTHDSWGSHLTIQTKDNVVKRVLPNLAPGIHEHWISDRDRFSYEGLTAADRALLPMACDPDGKTLKETPWKDALQRTAERLQEICDKHGSDKIGFFISPRATCEEASLMQRIASHLGCKNIDSRLQQRHFDGEDISGFGISLSRLRKIENILFIGATPARELPLLAAYLRQNSKKKKIFSIAAEDMSAQLPLAEQVLVSPAKFSSLLAHMLDAAGAKPPAGYAPGDRDLFSDNANSTLPINKIINQLAGDNTVIWLGDSARHAADYAVITTLAKQLAKHLGCAVGTLSDGGNGVGVRRAGALPPAEGMHTAAMLRADLRAVVLLRCEKADFAEAALATKMLHAADFVCAITSHSGGINTCSTVLLPAAEFSETDGSYINGDGEINTVTAAAPPPGKARPAWKILRLLGEYLQLPGFDFTSLDAVRAPLQLDDDSKQTAPLPLVRLDMDNSTNNGLCLHGEMPHYGVDMLVRRATALQKTPQGKAAQTAYMHPQDMRRLHCTENTPIIFCDADGNEEKTTVAADNRLAIGVVRFSPQHLTALDALTLRLPAEEKTA